MNPTLLDLLLQEQQQRQASLAGGVRAPGMSSGSKFGIDVGQRPEFFDVNAGMVAAAPGAKTEFYDIMAPMALQQGPSRAQVITGTAPALNMAAPAPAPAFDLGNAKANAPAGWNDSKLAEYYGGEAAAPWSWKPPEAPAAAPAAALAGASPTFREQYYEANGALKPEYDAAKRYSHYTPGGNYVGRQFSDGTPYDPIAVARQRSLSDPRTQTLLAERALENQGRLDAILAQDKGMARGKETDGISLMAAEAVRGITNPVQKMQAYNKMIQVGRAQQAGNNSELNAAGIRTPGARRPDPIANPGETLPQLNAKLESDANEELAIKAHTDRIAKLFQTAPVMNGAALVPGGAPLDPSKYNPEMANSLADILSGAQTPAQKEAILNEVARQAIDKNALGDVMVRAAAGHATLGGLPGVGVGSFYGGDHPSSVTGKQMELPFGLGSDTGFWGTMARLPNAVLGKPEAMYNVATLPGGRKVNIQTGDLYGTRNQAAASSTELQQSAARKAALKQYLETFMGKGYYK